MLWISIHHHALFGNPKGIVRIATLAGCKKIAKNHALVMVQLRLIVSGQTGLHGDHVLKPVVVEPKNLPDLKLCNKVMVEHVQDQVKNSSLVIAKAALVI